ncbi:hypothetical protein SAMN05192551_10914 [Tindallia magadiensis]|uniref:SMODS and SLOG-associating 2TM effector domain-containing protein n=1 Tax=Tindallia magadiensis TaxID=69895 RepID=A0A1I3GEF9_9FIRM|nr:hypothetical protein [Tindallia magadiensis]SFI21870.1 hypothetical protein SAMN05192551_10914 [Tindallia magadiensis]
MKNKEYLSQLYKKNEQGEFIIEVYIEKLLSAFNEWDSSYLEIRELNANLIYFIERCSKDIPVRQKIELWFMVAEENEEQEKVLKEALRANFKYQRYLAKQKKKLLYGKSAKYFVVALLFLLTAFSLKANDSLNLAGSLAVEGLYIGGWVFLWQAISMFSFESLEVIERIKIFERLLNSNIRIHYRS